MKVRKLQERSIPRVFGAGMLFDDKRLLFLVRKDQNGADLLEIPCLPLFSIDAISQLKIEFQRQTGIDCQVHEAIYQSAHNVGTRKRKYFVQVLAFRITAKNHSARPSIEFSSFKWLTIDEAKKQKLSRNCEWLLRAFKIQTDI